MLAGQVFHLEPGRAHFHAQGFHLVTAGDRTAVVVRKHDQWRAFQIGIKNALARDVEIVDVHQCELGEDRHDYLLDAYRRTTPTTTPHTMSSEPSWKTMDG